MKSTNSRHTYSYYKAKLEVKENHSNSTSLPNTTKLELGFKGGGYYIMLTNPEPYNLIKFFVFANNKVHALYRLQEFEEANAFVKKYPEAILNIISAGPQFPKQVEGLIHEQAEKKVQSHEGIEP